MGKLCHGPSSRFKTFFRVQEWWLSVSGRKMRPARESGADTCSCAHARDGTPGHDRIVGGRPEGQNRFLSHHRKIVLTPLTPQLGRKTGQGDLWQLVGRRAPATPAALENRVTRVVPDDQVDRRRENRNDQNQHCRRPAQ